jgi:hypothetical protein
MMFLLIMEVLNELIRKAGDWALFQQHGVHSRPYHTSLYADNMIIFLSPTNLQLAQDIFSLFEGCSGLGCNVAKFQMIPIHCDEQQIQLATSLFPCQLMDFPLKYLGIPLSVRKLDKFTLQPLVDRMADMLPV